jgi:hypothetical protein
MVHGPLVGGDATGVRVDARNGALVGVTGAGVGAGTGAFFGATGTLVGAGTGALVDATGAEVGAGTGALVQTPLTLPPHAMVQATLVIQAMAELTRAYTPGHFGSAQPYTHDTTKFRIA